MASIIDFGNLASLRNLSSGTSFNSTKKEPLRVIANSSRSKVHEINSVDSKQSPPPSVMETNAMEHNATEDLGHNSSHLTSASSSETTVNLDTPMIYVNMFGNMANSIGFYAFNYGVKLWLEAHYPDVKPRMIFQSRFMAKRDLLKCMPAFRDAEYRSLSKTEIERQRNELSRAGIAARSFIHPRRTSMTTAVFETSLHQFMELFLDPSSHRAIPNATDIEGPYFPTLMMAKPFLFDWYFDDFQQRLDWDVENPDCCLQMPDEDESVFVSVLIIALQAILIHLQHFRNFETELGEVREKLAELDANNTAYKLFAHLQRGDKVAITTRYNNELAQSYVAAFQERGIEARIVSGGSATQDFCFLMHAKKELVGVAASTFLQWAGLLGNASVVRQYSVSPSMKDYQVPWTNPKLLERFKFVYIERNSTFKSNDTAHL